MQSTKICELSVDGMHCDACELFIEETIKRQVGVQKVNANSDAQHVSVVLAETTDIDEFKRKVSDQIEKQGYRIVETLVKSEHQLKTRTFSAILAVIIFSLFLLLQNHWFLSLPVNYPSMMLTLQSPCHYRHHLSLLP